MKLPDHFIEAIFTKLSLAYGRDFTSKWEGLELQNVKADWAHELRNFAELPTAIRYALENLPAARAPNVFEFRDICRRAPRETPLMLKEHFKKTPEADRIAEKVRAELMNRMRQARASE